MQKSVSGLFFIIGFGSIQSGLAATSVKNTEVTLNTVEVKGRVRHLLTEPTSASQGIVGQGQIANRPIARVGELIEVVPGALATQHSGSGKANQFFLRGFNLDHGTDFSVKFDGVPMNMPSHTHGQGYLDMNSIIPEMLEAIEYGKGPYYAEVGDFASAGYMRMLTKSVLPKGLLQFTGGEFGYYRTLVADDIKIAGGNLLAAGEFNFYNGIWNVPEDLNKYNGMVKYTLEKSKWGLSLNAKAYHASWNATNQIPQRAIDDGTIDLYGSMDASDGGNSNRYSVSGNYWSRGDAYRNDFNVYAIYYDVNLFSNLTGYLDYPEKGDQISQTEKRVVVGGDGEQSWFPKWFGREFDNRLGLQIRHDEVTAASLNHTEQRQVFDTVRQDAISETSVGIYGKNQIQWLKKFRTIAGLRADFFNFNVDSKTLTANSGKQNAAMLSPKLSLIFGPWLKNQLFVNMGYGYHSNNARGVTLRVDPVSGDPASSVTPLVWSRGGEAGVRSQFIDGLTTTLALWWLQMNSELIFVGDTGATEPGGRSERQGIEWSNLYKVNDWLTIDADFAFSAAHYVGVPHESNHVPNSVGQVISAGAVIQLPYQLHTIIRLRHFGDIPLNETGSFYAGNTTLVNWGLGYQYKAGKVELDLFNVFNAKSSDIAYAYTSRLSGEVADGVDGILRHPVQPRMVRLTASVSF